MSMTDKNSNVFLEMGEEVIQLPDPTDVSYEKINPEIYLQRMSTMTTPGETIRDLIKGYFTLKLEDKLHESQRIRNMTITGFVGGLVFGGVLRSPDIHSEYQRKHNAAIFENRHIGHRHFWDTLISGTFSRGLNFGVRTCLLTTSAGFIGYGSIAIRNKLYLPDFLIGFTTLGAVSRLWLGLRGVTAGAAMGLTVGFIGYGFGKLSEYLSGYSVAQMRYLHHKEWMLQREAKHRRLLEHHEKNRIEEFKRSIEV